MLGFKPSEKLAYRPNPSVSHIFQALADILRRIGGSGDVPQFLRGLVFLCGQ
jgi:hypothetical protein